MNYVIMSWFGETFGDSLTSLKGQITKITKEVLADDDSPKEITESDLASLKELQALCDSKDVEIAALREEFGKLQNQYQSQVELLKIENEKYKSDGVQDNTQEADKLSQLNCEIMQLKEEKNFLNSCLDELQSEHQINLNHAVSIRDKYKRELEEVKKDYNSVKLELEEISKNQASDTLATDLKKVIAEKDSDIEYLRSEIKNLHDQLQVSEKTRNELISDLKIEVGKSIDLRKELEKLTNDIKVFNDEKNRVKDEKKSITLENENLLSKLKLLEKENNSIQTQIKTLLQEKKEFLQKNNETKSDMSTNNWTDLELKLKNLLEKFNVSIEENSNEPEKLIDLIESKLKFFEKIIEEKQGNYETSELEKKMLKDQNNFLQNEIKSQSEKWLEMEQKYQDDIKTANKQFEETKAVLESKLLETEQQKHVQNESQTDDVKRLEQEVSKLLCLCETKTEEIKKLEISKSNLEQEIQNLKVQFSENSEVKKLESELSQIKNKEVQLINEKADLGKELTAIKSENAKLCQMNAELKSEIEALRKQISDLNTTKIKTLQEEFEKAQTTVQELQLTCNKLEKTNSTLSNECEKFKAQVIIKETNIAELMKSNMSFQDEINKLQTKNNELCNSEKELQKWKNASVDLEIQKEDLATKIETLESECLKLKSDLELLSAKDAEIVQLKQANSNLVESNNRLHQELESKIQSEHIFIAKENELLAKLQQQVDLVAELQDEKNELNSRIQKFQEQMKIQVLSNQETPKSDFQQHKRSKSAVDCETNATLGNQEMNEEVQLLKQSMKQQQAKYKELQNQYQEILGKEGNARKEFERLKNHLIEVENHYTQEAVESEKVVNDLKSKLMAAEEQLKNSSTLYTSVKIRDNQHLESLQNQIRLITAQRDDFQVKLSAAEDEIQRHKASLTSLQIVLEQFQQDKEREVEEVGLKYEKQIQINQNRFKESQIEMDGLQKQLSEAKNGLKAASRLGEQLEKKAQQVVQLEESANVLQNKITELESSLKAANQAVTGKVDKSLLKNLFLGYVSSTNQDRKSQVLRIMASVLDFDETEREKMGVNATGSGWLANILHPKTGGPPSNESLSEAFIKFLESESRPQPQLKLLPEQFKPPKQKPSSASPKPHGVFQELVLPTFNSPQENESSVILKSVLKDS